MSANTQKSFLLFFFILLLAPGLVLAQADCPEIIRAALDATDEACDTTGRNQACYGNITLQAEPQDGVADFNFSNPGDIVDVSGVKTLTLLPWDEDETVWGIALMKLQTNLPDNLPGQNVTFLLFGDVQMNNAVETNTEPVTFAVTAQGDLNVLDNPSADGGRIAGMADGYPAIAIGRNAQGDWLQIVIGGALTGWVPADRVTTADDISLLNIIDPANQPASPGTPMQAFYFRSGISDAPCAEAPDSGILVQTPEGSGRIEFTVNEVHIALGSTIYLQAQPGGDMTISIVEGYAEVEALGVTVVAPAGTQVRVPLNNNRQAAGPPVGPETYGDLSVLPVRLLEREITVAKALTQDEIVNQLNAIPVTGQWMSSAYNSCDPTMVTNLFNFAFAFGDNGTDLLLTQTRDDGSSVTITYNRIQPGIYLREIGGEQFIDSTIRVLSDEHFIWQDRYVNCIITTDFALTNAAEAADEVQAPEEEAVQDVLPSSGQWLIVSGCSSDTSQIELAISLEDNTLILGHVGGPVTERYDNVEPGVYSSELNGTETTVHILSPDHFIKDSTFNGEAIGCHLDYTLTTDG